MKEKEKERERTQLFELFSPRTRYLNEKALKMIPAPAAFWVHLYETLNFLAELFNSQICEHNK